MIPSLIIECISSLLSGTFIVYYLKYLQSIIRNISNYLILHHCHSQQVESLKNEIKESKVEIVRLKTEVVRLEGEVTRLKSEKTPVRNLSKVS